MTDPATWRLVFPVDRKVGFLLVLAQVSDARTKQGMALAIRQAKAQGAGYVAQMQAAANVRYAICEEYRTRDLDEIASETPGNPRIPCNLVEKVIFRAASAPAVDEQQPRPSASELIVKTGDGKLEMTFGADRHEAAIVEGLRQVFGDRLR